MIYSRIYVESSQFVISLISCDDVYITRPVRRGWQGLLEAGRLVVFTTSTTSTTSMTATELPDGPEKGGVEQWNHVEPTK